MYSLCYNIKVGRYALHTLESVKIVRSVEALADTADIVLPATVFNRAIGIEDKVHKGDEVTIELGYDDHLKTEFKGYINTISTDGGSITLGCEDDIFLFRQALNDTAISNVTVKRLLEHVVKEVSAATGRALSVECNYDFVYDKYVIRQATGFDVLKKVQEEAQPNIYLKDGVLHVHPRYLRVDGYVSYDFSVNIDRDGTDLKYKDADERKVLVVCEGKDAHSKVIRVEEGTPGGDKAVIKISGVTSEASLRKAAKEMLARKVYTGFEGSFTGWLIPYCDAGYKVSIRDDNYEYKNGDYYALSVETNFSRNGGKRKITLGKRI